MVGVSVYGGSQVIHGNAPGVFLLGENPLQGVHLIWTTLSINPEPGILNPEMKNEYNG